MFRKFFSAVDRLVAAINGLAEKFETADRLLESRIAEGRPEPVALEGSAQPADPHPDPEPGSNGTAKRGKAVRS